MCSYQSDHSMFVESILHLQLPPFVDEFFKDVYSPICGAALHVCWDVLRCGLSSLSQGAAGKVLSFLGGIIYDILVRINHPGKVRPRPLLPQWLKAQVVVQAGRQAESA